MKTEETIFLKDTDINIENINIVELEEDEKNCIKSYVEITRHIQEINQLFHIYKCNLGSMLLFYTLNGNDILERNPNIKLKESDSMMINALTINLISSGKTLVDSIETFLKANTNQYETFKFDILNNIYDHCFYYRLLYHMRNFSQHGHIPVQVEGNMKCCFDLEQILRVPHFSHKEKMEEEMNRFKEEIYIKFGDHPRIVFSLSIAEYNLCIIKIYMRFLESIEQNMINFANKIKLIIEKYPEIIHKSEDSLNGYVLYDIEDNNVQCFDSKEDFIAFFLTIKEEISNLFIDEEKELENFRKGFKK